MKFLISGVAGDIAQSIVQILRSESSQIKIIGIDAKDTFIDAESLDEFIKFPHAQNSERYLSMLQKVLGDECFDFYIPTSEDELKMLAELDTEILYKIEEKTKIIWPGKEVVNTLLSKFETNVFLLRLGQEPPRTEMFHGNLRIIDFPVIVKPNYGRGSKEIFLCSNQEELMAAAVFTKNAVVQEFIPGEDSEFTCGVYRTGEVTKVIVLRRYLLGGVTSWAEVVADESIHFVCQQVAEALNLNGSINIQLRKNGSRVAIFEINPRFSSTILMRHKIGFHDLLWNLGIKDIADAQHELSVGKRIMVVRNVKVI